MERSRSRVSLGGTRVDVWAHDDLVQEVERRLHEPCGVPLLLASANLDHISHFGGRAVPVPVDFDDPAVEWLVLLDGVPLVWRSRRLLQAPVEQLAGSDLLGDLFALAARRGRRVGVFGGAPETHALLREVVEVSYPGLHLVQCWAPTREELGDPGRCRRLAEKVRAQDVDLLVVGLGKPRQEAFLADHGIATGARVAVAFGAAIDFLAGRVERAPVQFRRAGLEWLWRLSHEPRRLARRYLVAGPPGALALLRDSRVLTTQVLPAVTVPVPAAAVPLQPVPVRAAPADAGPGDAAPAGAVLADAIPLPGEPAEAAVQVPERRRAERRAASSRTGAPDGLIPRPRLHDRRVGQDRRVPVQVAR